MIYVAADETEAVDHANAIVAAIVAADHRPFVVAGLLIHAARVLAARTCGQVERAEVAAEMRLAAEQLGARVQ